MIQSTMGDSRASGLKAAQAMMQSYPTLVSGVLIGMAEGLQQGSAAKPAPPTARRK